MVGNLPYSVGYAALIPGQGTKISQDEEQVSPYITKTRQSQINESESVHRSVMSHSLRPRRLWPSRLLSPWNSPGRNTGVGSHSLLQGIFPTQGLNSGCRHILCPLSHPDQYTDHCLMLISQPFCCWSVCGPSEMKGSLGVLLRSGYLPWKKEKSYKDIFMLPPWLPHCFWPLNADLAPEAMAAIL